MRDSVSKFFQLLQRWNDRISLVSSSLDERSFFARHVRDAEELATLVARAGSRSLLDIGTGAGLPGILLKIMMPEIEVALIDSTRKKISFCQEAIRLMNLHGIRAICARAESEAAKRELGRFEAVASRATWKIGNFIDISVNYLDHTQACRIFAMKSQKIDEELGAAKKTIEKHGLELEKRHDYLLEDHTPRCILVFKPK